MLAGYKKKKKKRRNKPATYLFLHRDHAGHLSSHSLPSQLGALPCWWLGSRCRMETPLPRSGGGCDKSYDGECSCTRKCRPLPLLRSWMRGQPRSHIYRFLRHFRSSLGTTGTHSCIYIAYFMYVGYIYLTSNEITLINIISSSLLFACYAYIS